MLRPVMTNIAIRSRSTAKSPRRRFRTVIDEEFRAGRIKKKVTVEDMIDRSFINLC